MFFLSKFIIDSIVVNHLVNSSKNVDYIYLPIQYMLFIVHMGPGNFKKGNSLVLILSYRNSISQNKSKFMGIRFICF